ncbi:MAG TPA: VIT family protein [Hyphomicrobiaceae bacterium]|nr:VIT family protein [Hyphomicrobiaceae bacterium]
MLSPHVREHSESHALDQVGWLRAAVLGANDGIVSTASLIVGVAAANSQLRDVLIAGSAGLVAGAFSMAAGEYVSVSSQADAEGAALATERKELRDQPDFEHGELTKIYVERGVEPALAAQVATQLMAKDALGAHARDELGINDMTAARPVQAAVTSALTFAAGAALPMLATILAPQGRIVWVVSASALLFLALLGAIGAKVGKAPIGRAVARVTFWGAMALAATAAIGTLFGVAA